MYKWYTNIYKNRTWGENVGTSHITGDARSEAELYYMCTVTRHVTCKSFLLSHTVRVPLIYKLSCCHIWSIFCLPAFPQPMGCWVLFFKSICDPVSLSFRPTVKSVLWCWRRMKKCNLLSFMLHWRGSITLLEQLSLCMALFIAPVSLIWDIY